MQHRSTPVPTGRPTFLPVVLALVALPALAVAQAPPGYYASVDDTDATTLRGTLHPVIDDHQRFPYTSSATDTWDVLELADEDPSNPTRILDVYRNESYVKQGTGNPFYQREHTWPNSYGFPDDGSSNYPYTDCHQLFLCDGGYNGSRSNKPFRFCNASCDERPTVPNGGEGGGSGVYPGESNWTSGDFTSGTWEVWEDRRGDVARAIFYMDIRYEGGTHGTTGHAEPDLIVTDSEPLIDASNTGSNEPVAYMGMKSVLYQWHAQDPPDTKEMNRNDVVFSFQGNRNPFIDHPEWVDVLYGPPTGGPTGDPWINELHYDNAGTDTGELVEVAGPAGLDLAGWSLVGYNGNGGAAYDTVALAGVLPDQGACIGTLAFAFPDLQNGSPDGIALVDPFNAVVQFLSYEGVLTATSGPAVGLIATDIGVTESSSTPIGWSLQLGGTGGDHGAFFWQAEQPETPGAPNAAQTFASGCGGGGMALVYGCGINPSGSLVVVSGSPAIGTAFVVGVDNPIGTQAVGSLAFVALATGADPSFPCGTLVPGFGMTLPTQIGELLISLAPPNPLAPILVGSPWTGPGNPVAIPISVPNDPGLIGFELFAQGLMLDPFPPQTVKFGLTEAVKMTIGS